MGLEVTAVREQQRGALERDRTIAIGIECQVGRAGKPVRVVDARAGSAATASVDRVGGSSDRACSISGSNRQCLQSLSRGGLEAVAREYLFSSARRGKRRGRESPAITDSAASTDSIGGTMANGAQENRVTIVAWPDRATLSLWSWWWC